MVSQDPHRLGIRSGWSRAGAKEICSLISHILEETIDRVACCWRHRSFIGKFDRLDLVNEKRVNAWVEFSEDVFRVEFERDVVRELFCEDLAVVAVDVELERVFE